MAAAPGTRFVVDLGAIVLPDEQARSIEHEIRRVVLTALAGLDLVPRTMVPPDGPFDPLAPVPAGDFGTGLPDGEVYCLLVGPDDNPPPTPPLDVFEDPF